MANLPLHIMTKREKKARRELRQVLLELATWDNLYSTESHDGLVKLRKAIRRIGDELGDRPMSLKKNVAWGNT